MLGACDGVVAGLRTHTSGVFAWAGCLAASAVVYGAVWAVVLLAAGMVLHSAMRARPALDRTRALLALGLGLGLFLDLYWWTRPWLFYGLPASDWRRVGVAAALLAVGLLAGWAVVRLAARAATVWKSVFTLVVPVTWLGGLAFLLVQSSRTRELGAINERNRDLPNVLLFSLRRCAPTCSAATGIHASPRRASTRSQPRASCRARARPGTLHRLELRLVLHRQVPAPPRLQKMTADARMTSNITLASHLKSAQLAGGGKLEPNDYHCLTFMTGALSQASGLVRGFDSYYEAFMARAGPRRQPLSVFRSELVLVDPRGQGRATLGDGAVASEAAQWLREHGDERFFAMVHLFATHTPYDPPADLRELYCDPRYDGPVTAFRSDHREAIESGARRRPQPTSSRSAISTTPESRTAIA